MLLDTGSLRAGSFGTPQQHRAIQGRTARTGAIVAPTMSYGVSRSFTGA